MLHVLLSYTIIFLIIYGIEGFGVIPKEIFARVNDSIKISCFVDAESGELNFYDGENPVPTMHINRINHTYIEYRNVYSKPTKKNYTCKQDIHSVDYSEVYVDGKMGPVINFHCFTRDLGNVTCSFKMPKAFLPIKYNLTFAFNGGLVENSKLLQDGRGGYSTKIEVENQITNVKVKSFNESSSSDVSLDLILIANNKFYKRKEKFGFKLMELLTPNPISDMKVMDDLTTESSVNISFNLPKELEKVANDMIFDITLRVADNQSMKWKIDEKKLLLKKNKSFLILDDLEYANTAYTVQIKMKARIASEELWSPYKEVTFRTRQKIAETLPQTCTNCFNVMYNGNIFIYWMEVPKLQQNAENFSYLVLVRNEDGKEIFRSQQQQTSMVLQRSNLNATSLNVQIHSANNIGISKGFRQLFIPLQKLYSLDKALKIRKERVDGDYQISWKQLQRIDVDSYTIIWCHQRNELLNQCDGSIEYQNMNADTTHFKVNATSLLQFGLAVNHRNSSIIGGFKWAECTAAQPNQIGQVRSMWTNVNSQRSITLHWNLYCVDEPIVVGYNITYCLLKRENFDECEEPIMDEIVILNDCDELCQYEIVGLKTYRFYNVSVALMSHNRLGVHKNFIKTRTMEGVPTAPRALKATKVNNSSIEITWDRPLEMNGEAMTYQIWYNGDKVDIADKNTMNESLLFSIEQLKSFSDYTIIVRACTSECSKPSNSLKLRTAVGTPGEILQPTMEQLDQDKTRISWNAPDFKGGNLNFFDLKLSKLQDGKFKEKIYRINGHLQSCIIEGFNCDNRNGYFHVRAVNVEEQNESFLKQGILCFEHEINFDDESNIFVGEWSQPLIFYCTFGQSLGKVAFIFIFAVSSIVFGFMLVKLYEKYQRMKDIQTEWPSGLDPKLPMHSKEAFDGLKDFDLVKNHNLTDIEEEEEEEEGVEREKLLSFKTSVLVLTEQFNANQLKNSQSESKLNSMPIKHFYRFSSNGQKKVHSAPTSPEKHVAPSEFARDSYVDANTGYMKMNPPPQLRNESSTSVEGYLDMTGKSSSPLKLEPPKIIIESPPRVFTEAKKPEKNDYVTNEITNFIKDSEMFNNGYIGKRMSIVNEPQKKRAPVINSNGYVGYQRN